MSDKPTSEFSPIFAGIMSDQKRAANEEQPAKRGKRKPLPGFEPPTLKCDEDGKPIKSQGNIRIALQLLGVTLRFDELAQRMLIARSGASKIVQDHSINSLRLEIERRFAFLVGKEFFCDVCEDIARGNSFHPVREYLATAQPTWDRVPRIDTWLIDYAAAEDTAYVRAVSRLVMIAAVRRARKPGCKFDEMLVLEGEQGTLKSTALKALCADEAWFADEIDLGGDTRQVIEQTEGKWLIEAAELKGQSARENDARKAALSRTVDKARMSYGHYSEERPRQFVVIGTTNASQYLDDETGERRTWPIAIQQFDVAGLAKVRDLLWAEAATAEASGESIRLDSSLWPAAGAAQRERQKIDVYEEKLAPVLDGVTGKLRCEDVRELLGFAFGDLPNQSEQTRIGKTMRKLGWDRSKGHLSFVVNGARAKAYGYVKGTDAERGAQVDIRMGKAIPVAA